MNKLFEVDEIVGDHINMEFMSRRAVLEKWPSLEFIIDKLVSLDMSETNGIYIKRVRDHIASKIIKRTKQGYVVAGAHRKKVTL